MTCPAGKQEAGDTTFCEDCPVDTYKSELGPSSCISCSTIDGLRRITGGVIGATSAAQCKGNVYQIAFIPIISSDRTNFY